MKPNSLLIVDDEPSVRAALVRLLSQDGYEIRQASDGEGALRLMSERPADLLISDHMMPGMTGLELVREVRRLHPDTMRIILTGYADIAMAVSAINDGEIYRFLTKPWDANDLPLSIRLGFERLALARENQALLATVKRQSDVLRHLEQEHPGITVVERDDRGAVVIDEDDLNAEFATTVRSRG